jgi:hypothetical protein
MPLQQQQQQQQQQPAMGPPGELVSANASLRCSSWPLQPLDHVAQPLLLMFACSCNALANILAKSADTGEVVGFLSM